MKKIEEICKIKGITFYPFARRGGFLEKEALDSLDAMCKATDCNFVMLVPNGLQDTPQSEVIEYDCEANVSDEELIFMIQEIQKRGLMVGLKPTVNCKNGTWRAYISFFEEDVPCEAKWGNWFKAYTEFQLHYSKIAQDTGCDLFLPGCEMVMTEHREQEWRQVIASVRQVYHGLVSYNTDKYQEHRVKWWDALDLISSSGYYPLDDWTQQLDRIEQVVKTYQKPFFFAEAGCMSTKGSKYLPNNWMIQGDVDLEGQAQWFQNMFEHIKERDWVMGTVIWSWDGKLYSQQAAHNHPYYEIYQKPAQQVVYNEYHDESI